MGKKWVYLFTEGNADMRELLGGKGANLAEMTNIGLPVPQGFTITTEACTQYYEDGREINDEIMGQINEHIEKMEQITGKKFGDMENPLLVSVRSGARASMPGMMDTILNLGLNEDVVNVIAQKSGNPRWAWDCYRRFIQMYSDVVMEVGKKYFEELIDKMKDERGVKLDVELTADDLKELATQFKAEYSLRLARISQMILRNSYTELLKLYSVHGTTQELMYTEEIMIFLILGEQQLMYSLWHLVIWGMTVELVLHLQEILQLVLKDFLESSLLTHRVKMLLPA